MRGEMPPTVALLCIVVIVPLLICASEDPTKNIPREAAKLGLVNVRNVESRFWGLCRRSGHYDFEAEDRDGKTIQAYACCSLGAHCTIAMR